MWRVWLWVSGQKVYWWLLLAVEEHIHTRRKARRLGENQALCLRCKRPVVLTGARVVYQNRYMRILQGTCETCGARVNRAASPERP